MKDTFSLQTYLQKTGRTPISRTPGFLTEDKAYLYDADDYKPFEEIKVGDIVRYELDPEERWEVLAKGHGAQELRDTIEKDARYRNSLDPWVDYGIEDEDIQDWVITDGPREQPYVYWEYNDGGVMGHYSDDDLQDDLDECGDFDLTEDMMQDVDVPYADLKIDDIVVNEDSGEEYKILDILGDNKLIVSLVDDPRDISGVIYGQDVTKMID